MSEIEGYALSPQQKQLWLQGQGTIARAVAVIELGGKVDPAMIKRAVALLVAGHQILRTRFPVPKGFNVPLQVVEEDNGFTWREISGATPASLLQDEWRLPVTPDQAPLRATLVTEARPCAAEREKAQFAFLRVGKCSDTDRASSRDAEPRDPVHREVQCITVEMRPRLVIGQHGDRILEYDLHIGLSRMVIQAKSFPLGQFKLRTNSQARMPIEMVAAGGLLHG